MGDRSNQSPFTIAVCTRNRAGLLAMCLEALRDDLRDDGIPPILVVDNGSTDHTREVSARFSDDLGVRRVEEPRVGLSTARNRAISECETRYIVYLDDDAKPVSGWGDAVRNGIADWAPDCFGGPYRPFYLEQKPAWFHDAYGSMHLEKKLGLLSTDQSLSGGNMGWKVSTLNTLGGFPEDLGMKADALLVGEESNLQHRLIHEQPNNRRVFLPEMQIRHLVSGDKLSVLYWLKRAWVYGWTYDLIRPGSSRIPVSTAVLDLLSGAVIGCAIPFRDRSRYPYWQNAVLERLRHRVKRVALVARRLAGAP